MFQGRAKGPDGLITGMLLGAVLLKLGHPDEARGELERALEAVKTDPTAAPDAEARIREALEALPERR
jgi:hypothetical protein